MRAVLVGNQNCGKTTLFNLLTGSNQKIGNWPGVTVSKKSGIISDLDLELIDLPGIYSLSPYSLEEKISCGYLLNEEYDLIINVVDSTTLERGLFLTTELLELNKKVIIILNMIDRLENKGIRINIDNLRQSLATDICLVSATSGRGIIDLLKKVRNTISGNNSLKKVNKNIINSFNDEKNIKLRYDYVDDLCKKCIKKVKKINHVTGILDKILLNKFLAIPIFFIIMFGMYYVSIELFGKAFLNFETKFIENVKIVVEQVLLNFNTKEWIISLVCKGIITGVGSILSFLPQLSVIFIVTSFLEASGYMSRVAFIFDKLLKKCGLNGKSLIPFILGTGCSVPGIMATKIIEKDDERINTIITTPFVPCSAKLPIITLFTSYFFKGNYAMIATSFYILSLIIIIVSSLMIKRLFSKSNEELYIFELPEYKLPSIKFLYRDVKLKIFEFINKAGTVIFLVSIMVWFLLSFSTKFEYGVDISNSILAFCGKKMSSIFYPILGVKSWEASVSAIQGLIAKEQVVSSMEIIAGLSGEFKNTFELFDAASPFEFFTIASSYSFVAFNLFTVPCIGAITSMLKELKNVKFFLLAIFYQLIIGWSVAAFLFYALSKLQFVG
ncbi:MAG: ferrous iron transporter B [Clostridia bacterium]|nr:ferrous iron transporter B [Clostridia bacterium]